jgi:hypothetical protein
MIDESGGPKHHHSGGVKPCLIRFVVPHAHYILAVRWYVIVPSGHIIDCDVQFWRRFAGCSCLLENRLGD